VRALGVHVPAGRLPCLPLQPSELADARARLDRLGLRGQVLGLGLGSSRPTKSWPEKRFAALALAWCRAKPQGSVLALAGPQEEPRVHEFLQALDDLLSAEVPDTSERARLRSRISSEAGLTLRQLAAALGALSVFAGNDSGPRHVAVATGTPTVTLFGPEHPFEWHPYPGTEHPFIFIDNLACRRDADAGMPAWCGLHECVAEQHKCMNQIGVDAVLEACLKVARA
jgi:ADP-heptose:LPS heptosyltransferase